MMAESSNLKLLTLFYNYSGEYIHKFVFMRGVNQTAELIIVLLAPMMVPLMKLIIVYFFNSNFLSSLPEFLVTELIIILSFLISNIFHFEREELSIVTVKPILYKQERFVYHNLMLYFILLFTRASLEYASKSEVIRKFKNTQITTT